MIAPVRADCNGNSEKRSKRNLRRSPPDKDQGIGERWAPACCSAEMFERLCDEGSLYQYLFARGPGGVFILRVHWPLDSDSWRIWIAKPFQSANPIAERHAETWRELRRLLIAGERLARSLARHGVQADLARRQDELTDTPDEPSAAVGMGLRS